jgi:hypothetical protein
MRSAGTALALLLLCAGGAAREEVTIEKLDLGAHWHGAEISKKDLLGKVVLVTIYGS